MKLTIRGKTEEEALSRANKAMAKNPKLVRTGNQGVGVNDWGGAFWYIEFKEIT